MDDDEEWLRADCLDLYKNRIFCDGAVRVGKRGRMLRFSINHAWPVLTDHPDALFLEFGVHTGRDLCLIDRMVGQKESEPRSTANIGGDDEESGDDDAVGRRRRRRVVIHGFDSFRGLPEDWDNGQNGEYDRGKFDLGGVPPDLKEVREYLGFPDDDIVENVKLHVGWFEDTLPGFFDLHPRPVAYCHADADLYGSTITFLEEMCRRRLLVRGSVITFDEYANYPGWERGEHLAWTEVTERHGIEYRYVCYHAPSTSARNGKSYNPHGYQSVSVVVTMVSW